MAGNKYIKLPFSSLTAINPLDGRYHEKTYLLSSYVSEYALIKTRIEVEILFLLELSKIHMVRTFSKKEKEFLGNLIKNFSIEDAEQVKEIEKQTRHDVKAVERFLRNVCITSSLADVVEKIHFGLTSEDINNIAYRLLLKRATQNILIPQLEIVLDSLIKKVKEYKKIPMLARTHGQAALPTTLGKELVVFAYRLHNQIEKLKKQNLSGKLNGATGNYNALYLINPKVDWILFSKKFIKSIGLEPSIITIQINPYDDVIEYLQIYQRINGIILDLNLDMWRYISDSWFIQEIKQGEVGSSTMPQKVNPIDFENSEGNIYLANALIEGFIRKLSVSRLQRDLSDSTVIRNIGTLLGYCFLSYMSTHTGLSRVRANLDQIQQDLDNDWSILSEGVQTHLRNKNVKDPYTQVASLVKGKKITKQNWEKWLHDLPVSLSHKKILKNLKPSNYIGLAIELTEQVLSQMT